MRPISKQAQKTLEKLAEGLVRVGDHRRVDNYSGAFMAVSVEVIDADRYGGNLKISVAHYYTQNGDMMRDPEMIFWKADQVNRWYPIYFRQDGSIPIEQESVIFEGHTQGEDPSQIFYHPNQQKDHAVFANIWMKNIKNQQDLFKKRPQLKTERVQYWSKSGTMITAQLSKERANVLVEQGRAYIINDQAIGQVSVQA